MILNVFAIHDRVAGFYGVPFFLTSLGEARRAFADLANDLNTNVGRHPGDFALYHLGQFNNESGAFDMIIPEFITGAGALLVKQPTLPLNPEA